MSNILEPMDQKSLHSHWKVAPPVYTGKNWKTKQFVNMVRHLLSINKYRVPSAFISAFQRNFEGHIFSNNTVNHQRENNLCTVISLCSSYKTRRVKIKRILNKSHGCNNLQKFPAISNKCKTITPEDLL